MTENNPNLPQAQNFAEDEINLLEYIYVLVKNKWIIIGMAILGFAIGYIAAMVKGPVYVANAVIASREVESISTPNFSGLGMFGGMVASQFKVSGNASMENVELLLGSRTFNAKIVEEMKIDQMLAPTLFSEIWDTTKNNWKVDSVFPNPVNVGAYISSKVLKRETLENGTMVISVEYEDSTVAYNILSIYLKYLDSFVKVNAQKDAEENSAYLENQLLSVSDPLLRAKIQELIAKEVEKMMIVSKEAFRIVDEPMAFRTFKSKKIYPLLVSVLLFLFTIVLVLLKYAYLQMSLNSEDDELLNNIKKEMFRLK